MTMMLYRALIKTHHMTSRTKIRAIIKAAKKCHCAVYLKTGKHPPGVMIAECDQGEEYLKEWAGSVKVGKHIRRCSKSFRRLRGFWPFH